MTPQQRYQEDLCRADFSPDPAQLDALHQAQRLFDDLLAREPCPKGFAWSRWARRRGGRRAKGVPVKGMYIWGSVGRGKTYVMDTLFERPI